MALRKAVFREEAVKQGGNAACFLSPLTVKSGAIFFTALPAGCRTFRYEKGQIVTNDAFSLATTTSTTTTTSTSTTTSTEKSLRNVKRFFPRRFCGRQRHLSPGRVKIYLLNQSTNETI